jgi:hypothetical protein
MIEDIKTPQPYLTVFPDAKDVFAEPVEKYATLLNPFISIDLSAVNPAWAGKIHLVSPVEPVEGFIGQYTQDFHNDFLKTNWIAFKLNADNKYELMGDFNYFEHENNHLKELHKEFQKEFDEHYAKNQKGFAEAKENYAKYGALYDKYGGETLAEKQAYYDEPSNLLDQLGGNTGWANWTVDCEDFGVKLNAEYYLQYTDTDAVYPIGPNGNRFYFIASVPAWHYITNGHGGADAIVLFYEPIERIAWLTFDYT